MTMHRIAFRSAVVRMCRSPLALCEDCTRLFMIGVFTRVADCYRPIGKKEGRHVTGPKSTVMSYGWSLLDFKPAVILNGYCRVHTPFCIIAADWSIHMRFNSIKVFVICLCVLGMLAHAAVAVAQVSASLSGTITEATGGAVGAASVTARNVETGVERTVMTDAEGVYRILVLPVGEYQIRTTKSGFSESVREGVHLSVGQQAVVDFALKVGNVEQQIRVVEDASPVSTTTSDISGLVAEQQ